MVIYHNYHLLAFLNLQIMYRDSTLTDCGTVGSGDLGALEEWQFQSVRYAMPPPQRFWRGKVAERPKPRASRRRGAAGPRAGSRAGPRAPGGGAPAAQL